MDKKIPRNAWYRTHIKQWKVDKLQIYGHVSYLSKHEAFNETTGVTFKSEVEKSPN